MTPKPRLKSLRIQGFKSFRDVTFEPGNLTVMIGANGSGKSNLLSLFTLLRRMVQRPGEFQLEVLRTGGRALCFDGGGAVATIQVGLAVQQGDAEAIYGARWVHHGSADTLVFLREFWEFADGSHRGLFDHFPGESAVFNPAPESGIAGQGLIRPESAAGVLSSFMRQSRVYAFADTQPGAGIRQGSDKANSTELYADGSNLAGFLWGLANGTETQRTAFGRIEERLRLILPTFAGFEFREVGERLYLHFRERGSAMLFNPQQASDGTIRLFALVALLQQPPEQLPPLLLVDEPELGLHPDAISSVAEHLRIASHHCQVVVATQSPLLVDGVGMENLLIVDRPNSETGGPGRETKLRRVDAEQYAAWLEEFSPGELWRRNVIGGGPYG